MDGTMWDAVDSYAKIWNDTFDAEGVEHSAVTRHDLLRLMGSYLSDIMRELAPCVTDHEHFMRLLVKNETEMMPRLGGKLYPGVREVTRELSKHYRLFMVSNCGPDGLKTFARFAGLEDCFTDLLTHGGTGKSKAENIKDLIAKYDLKAPVYVGDTQGDADNTHRAGIPFVWAAYGFGHVTDPDATIHTFDELPEAISQLNAHATVCQ